MEKLRPPAGDTGRNTGKGPAVPAVCCTPFLQSVMALSTYARQTGQERQESLQTAFCMEYTVECKCRMRSLQKLVLRRGHTDDADRSWSRKDNTLKSQLTRSSVPDTCRTQKVATNGTCMVAWRAGAGGQSGQRKERAKRVGERAEKSGSGRGS